MVLNPTFHSVLFYLRLFYVCIEVGDKILFFFFPYACPVVPAPCVIRLAFFSFYGLALPLIFITVMTSFLYDNYCQS